MIYKQELIAKDLFQGLQEYFNSFEETVQISIDGVGVHWNCNVVLGQKQCKVSCFEGSLSLNHAAEYLIEYIDNSKQEIWGRIYDKNQTIESIKDWISGENLSVLYERYDFIDEEKRAMKNIDKDITNLFPELKNTIRNIKRDICDSYSYEIISKNRNCKLTLIEPSQFSFYVDETKLFEPKLDFPQLAEIIKLWLVDELMPSKIEAKFEDLDLGELAKYYEKGKLIEGEFIRSWDFIEEFYGRTENGNYAINFIKTIMDKGFTKTLRAGQSLYSFILSRSRRWGLREEQKCIIFQFNFKILSMKMYNIDNKMFYFDKIEYNTEIENALKDLEREAIN